MGPVSIPSKKNSRYQRIVAGIPSATGVSLTVVVYTQDMTALYIKSTSVDFNPGQVTRINLILDSVSATDIATFADMDLEDKVRDAISIPYGDLLKSDLYDLKTLDASNSSISNLEGIENCTYLEYLNLSHNNITDISYLVQNPGLGKGDTVKLMDTALDNNDYADIQQLIDNGVDVTHTINGFFLEDNFSDGNITENQKWELKYVGSAGSTNASASSQKLAVTSRALGWGLLVTGSSEWTDYSIQAKVNLTDISDSAGVALGIGEVDKITGLPNPGAVFYYNGDDRKLVIQYRKDTSVGEEKIDIRISPGTPFTLKLTYNYDQLIGEYDDGTPTRTVSLSSVPSGIKGKPGLGVYLSPDAKLLNKSSMCTFDDVIIESN